MAGIGFELRKIYNEDSLFSKQKAYAYAGIVYTGPMLLGILLTAGVVVLTMVAGISENERDYILSNLTYAIIFSLVITSLFSLVVTRFVADMLYEKKFETIIPSFYASSALMLLIGTPLYAI
ncbi:putative membrane spanning protein [Streptococcus salivarius K12]|nr:putative membrane spanning protein [Streptococcus salivarius K12]